MVRVPALAAALATLFAPCTLHARLTRGRESLFWNLTKEVAKLPIKRGTFIYASQGKDQPPLWVVNLAKRSDTLVLWGAWGASDLTTVGLPAKLTVVRIPQTTWTTGRNALYLAALERQLERRKRAEYLILTDDDAEIFLYDETRQNLPLDSCGVLPPSPGEDAVSLLHRTLSTETPAMASLHFGSRNQCWLRSCGSDTDAFFNAFHALAQPHLLPYMDDLDHISVWNSQALMIEAADALFRGPEFEGVVPVVQYNQFGHHPRPGGAMVGAGATYIRSTKSFAPKKGTRAGQDTDHIAFLRRRLPPPVAEHEDC